MNLLGSGAKISKSGRTPVSATTMATKKHKNYYQHQLLFERLFKGKGGTTDFADFMKPRQTHDRPTSAFPHAPPN
ncbi:unnamed protein product [Ceratitis capitata]|uniref:(Mediterranean fruit fly) hypothetical protein n=1 Tax=Ceratitis capitata TaxID=7213 RepID=A0A811UIE0_CERCA|nr:unnamed protein product [Ceratitis capitata]